MNLDDDFCCNGNCDQSHNCPLRREMRASTSDRRIALTAAALSVVIAVYVAAAVVFWVLP